MPRLCPKLTTKLESLKKLKQEFDLELTKVKNPDSKKSNDLIFIRDIKAKLNQTLQDLQTELWLKTPELTKENLEAQYEFQKNLLLNSGLLKTLSTGELGIKAIDKQEYPIPTLEQVEENIIDKRELLEAKVNQGFVKLVLVPFGLPVSSLIDAYDKALMEHYQQGELLDAQNKLLNIYKRPDDEEFISDHTGYPEAEAKGDLVYFPKKFSANHQGKTKQELLPTQAWQVLLLEDLPDLPDRDQGKTKAGRQQPEACQIFKEYLKKLQTDPQYKGEQGLTLESWLIYGLSCLVQTNQVIDSRGGPYRGCFLVNSYFKSGHVRLAGGSVPLVGFGRDSKNIVLDSDGSPYPNSEHSARFAVSVF
ncbi:MAG: hypothetical protein WCW02_00370 [Candidatus Buchananbacteria bacterium]